MEARSRSALLLFAVLLTSAPMRLPGQSPASATTSLPRYHIPQGLWLSAGPGYGQADCGLHCRMFGPTGNLEVGWAIGRKLLLSAAALGWTKADESIRITNGSLGARARYYPVPNLGFFFSGGLGLGIIRFSPEGDTLGHAVTTTGYAMLGGFGCDFRIADGLSLTPFLNWSGIRTHDGPNHLRTDVWQGGMALTVH
jgi:hypothetical protein